MLQNFAKISAFKSQTKKLDICLLESYLFNRALRSCKYICMFVRYSCPNGWTKLTYFEETLGYPWI